MKTQLNRLDAHQPLTTVKLPLPLGSTATQSFLSIHNQLNIYSVCLRNPDRLLVPITFTLHEATTSAKALRTIEFNGGNIDNADCTRLQFEPLEDSAGKTYFAKLTVNALDPQELPVDYRDLYLEADQDTGYPAGTAYLNSTPLGLDFHFKTHYSQPISEVVKESLSQLPPRFLQDPGFSLFYLALLAATLYLLLRRR